MGVLSILLIGLGMAIDAFSVSLCIGLAMDRINIKKYIIIGMVFAITQTLILGLGYLLGGGLGIFTNDVNNWISFIMLYIVGICMVNNSFKEDRKPVRNERILSVLFLAIATSIDALAVGLTFSLSSVNLFMGILLIGFMTWSLSIIGLFMGSKMGIRYEKRAEFIGGVIFMLIGLEILFQGIGIF